MNEHIKATLYDLEMELYMRDRDKIVWKTKDGREIPIKDMEYSHLVNTINYIKKTDALSELKCEFDAMDYGDQ